MKITLAVMGKIIYKRARLESEGCWAMRSLMLIKKPRTWSHGIELYPQGREHPDRVLGPLLCFRATEACKVDGDRRRGGIPESPTLAGSSNFWGKGLIILPVALMFCL